MSAAASLQPGSEEGAFVLRGELGFTTARTLLEQSAALFAAARAVHIDLAGVTRVDSAGIALLLEWLARARANGQGLTFSQPPPQLLAIARASGLDTLLPLGVSGEE